MKIRYALVSNSSSSSYCLYGVCLETIDAWHQLKETKLFRDTIRHHMGHIARLDDESFKDECLTEEEITDEIQCREDDREINEILSDMGFVIDYDSRELYLGLSLTHDMKDDETKAQFRERAQKAVDDILGPGHKVQLILTSVYS